MSGMLCQRIRCVSLRHRLSLHQFCDFESPTFVSACRVSVTSRAPSHDVCASPAIFPAGFQGKNTLLEKKKFHSQLFVSKRPFSPVFSESGGPEPKRGGLLSYRSGLGSSSEAYCRRNAVPRGEQLSKCGACSADVV